MRRPRRSAALTPRLIRVSTALGRADGSAVQGYPARGDGEGALSSELSALRGINMNALLVAVITVLLGQGAEGALEKKAIQKLLDDQALAWNKGDLRAFMTGYWESPELSFFSGNKKTHGWQATLERYEKTYQGEG